MRIIISSKTPALWRSKKLGAARALLGVTLAICASASAAPMPAHNVPAANLNVIQNDTASTTNSVTVTAPLSINDLLVRTGSVRGLYSVRVGAIGADDPKEGFIMASLSENGRLNPAESPNPFYGITTFATNTGGFLVGMYDATANRTLFNANCASAYFRYTNWLCGWARNSANSNGGTNNLFTASPGLALGTHFKGIGNGESRVDLRQLGISSTNAGVLMVSHAKNEGNFALSVASADGTWEVYIKDNFGNAANPLALEQDPAAFVFIPKTQTNVVSGKFGLDATGTSAQILMYSGDSPAFAVTNIDIGRYRLTIPGYSPAYGVLLVSPEGGYASNFDNIVSYQADNDGWIIESRDTGVYPPVLEACTNEPVASFVFIPGATPGFTVAPSGTQITTEFGGTANFTVVLDVAPTSDVTISLSSSDLTEGTVSPASLTFTPANWNVPQSVTVTGVDDALPDGPIDYTIVLSPAVSADPAYNGLDPADVPARNLDDDTTAISVSPTSGLTTTEAGGTATFSVSISRPPSGNVTIGLSSSDLTEGTVSPSSLTFTPGNWSTAQIVTVTGVNDFKPDGNVAYTIVTAPAVSTDAGYNNLDAADVSVLNLDDDVAGIIWNYTLPITVLEGSSTHYSIALATQPDSNVVVEVSSSSTAIGTVFPATLTFTPLDWATPKDVTVSGVENLTVDGPVNFFITNNIVTLDPVYSSLPVTNFYLPAVVLDNEPQPSFAAANLNVVQNDSANTEASVTVTTTLSINDMKVRTGSNRGDYNLQVGDSGADDLGIGLVMASVSQNGRYNLDESSEPMYGAPAFDGNANGYWAVLQDCTDARAEYNVNCSVAFFRWTNWLAGWARNVTAVNGGTNDLFTGSPGVRLGTQFRGISNGRSRVDLRSFGIGSTNAGVLIVNHAKNEGNYCTSVANPDGTWEVYVKDNFGNAANPFALEQDPAAFVFIPRTNTTVVSGKFGQDGSGAAQILIYSGSSPAFTVSNIADGRYRLTIPGATPAQGVLIVSAEGGYTNNFDNVVSYEADGDGWIIESRDTGVYPPALEACPNEPVASFVFFPAVAPGFVIAPNDILLTTESGGTANFTLKLATRPASDVTINLSSSNPGEGIVSPVSFTFTPANWNLAQTATVTGQDDAVADGPVSYTIVLAPAVSADADYNGLDPADVSVVNIDNEQAGISVTPTVGLLTSESGSSASFAVFLNRQPTANVMIGFSSSNPNEGTVAPASLIFTPTDWNTPKLVTVTGVDDFVQDGNVLYTIQTAPAVSADPSYNGLKGSDVSVRNLDDDVPGYVWNYTLPLTVIEGQSITYSVKLATQPYSNVVIQAASGNTSAGTISPASRTFTPANWNIPQNFTLTGVDNLVANPDVNFTVIHTPVTSDPTYSQLSSAISLPAILVDNEAKFTLPSGDCVYGLGMPPIGIDGEASLLDPDAISYNQGSVTVTLTTNASPVDLLGIRSAGIGLDQISVSGTNVSYQGNVIGSFLGGSGSTPLSIALNTNSTIAAVQKLIRSITFTTPVTNASLLSRSVIFNVADGLGGTVGAGKTIRVGALRQLQYQENGDYGYGEYHGAGDIALSQVGANTPWPIGRTPTPAEGLLIDWPDGGTLNESQVLLRFDDFVGTNYWQVPPGAVVVSAELLLRVNNPGDGGTLHRMLIPWDADNATWNSLGGGVQADDVTARSMYESQIGVEDGSGATGTGIITVGVTPDVQAWVNGETNYGWAIMGWPLQTDGTGFTPSEDAIQGDRPRLRIKWLEPVYQVVTFQQGVDGYASTHDTNLRQATPDVNYVGDVVIWSDANDAGNTNNTQFLLRFDDITGTATNQIPPGALIHSAVLELASVATDSMGDGGQFFAMLQPWDDTTVTWNTIGANGIQPNGIIAATTASAAAGNSGLDPDVQGTLNTFDVTADVQAWVSGMRTNYGWGVIPWPGGSNGWGSRSSEFISVVGGYAPESQRPRLKVYFSALRTVAAAVLQKPTVTPSQVQVPFTGTPGASYTIYRAGAVTGPWNIIGTVTVGVDGTATFTNSTPLAPQAFYRIGYP